MKLIIEVYAVTDQVTIDEDGATKTIKQMFDILVDQFNGSYLKNKVELKFIDVLKDQYDDEVAKQALSEKKLLPWIFFNGELEFYNGFSVSMIYNEALKLMKYKMVKRNIIK